MDLKKADFLVRILEEDNLTLGEALKVLAEAEEIIRNASRVLSVKKSKTALRDILRAARDYSSSGKSPD